MNSSFLSEFRPSRTRCLIVNCCSKNTPKRSGNLSNLESWQKDRLESAFIEGKRKTKITQLSNELKLSRSEVLTWFKEFEAIPKEFVKFSLFLIVVFLVFVVQFLSLWKIGRNQMRSFKSTSTVFV